MEAIVTPPCQTFVQTVLDCRPGQQLYLLGSTTIRQHTTSVFNTSQPTCSYTAHWFLLSLVREEGLREPQPDKQRDTLREPRLNDSVGQASRDTAGLHCVSQRDSLDVLQDKIENTFAQHFMPCTVLVLDLNTFNRWLAEDHPFACTIYRKAHLLHDAGYLLAEPVQLRNGSMTQCPNREKALARQFFAGAAFYRQRGDNAMAVFMLHQCAEQSLRALLKMATGYCPHTHNIDKLVRYCSMAVHRLTEIFHNRTPHQQRLYRLLRNAYTEARYGILAVTADDAEQITGKVKSLMGLLRDYREKA